MKPTVGCGSSGSEGEGPQGLPGLLISIAFLFLFIFVFLPDSAHTWFLTLFVLVEVCAAVLYILADRRNRREADRLRRQLHQINEKT